MSFVETEKDKKDDLVREGAIVKCSQGDGEIKMIFPPWGLKGGENNDINQMLDIYTVKAGTPEACFDKVFKKCKKAQDKEQKCVFSVYPLWQKVGTVLYSSNKETILPSVYEGVSMEDSEELNTIINSINADKSIFGKPSDHVVPSSMEQVSSFLVAAKKETGIDDIDRNLIRLAENIVKQAISNLPNVNDNPGGSGFNLLMKSELPCFMLGYLYFKENGKTENEEENIDMSQYGHNIDKDKIADLSDVDIIARIIFHEGGGTNQSYTALAWILYNRRTDTKGDFKNENNYYQIINKGYVPFIQGTGDKFYKVNQYIQDNPTLWILPAAGGGTRAMDDAWQYCVDIATVMVNAENDSSILSDKFPSPFPDDGYYFYISDDAAKKEYNQDNTQVSIGGNTFSHHPH